MNEHHYQRIDKGFTRRERKDIRALARSRPRSADGTFLPIDPERRARIIAETPNRIRQGQSTTQIALEHGIPARTLRSWLLADESVENARGEFLAQELTAQIEAIESATEPLPLARAREAFRAWSWIAERREHRLYGAKQELTVSVKPEFTVVLKPPIEGEACLIPSEKDQGGMPSPEGAKG